MRAGRIKSALALVGACAALSIVLPPLAGVLNAVGSLTLLALGGYSAYRAWAWLETVVEASRRPTTIRRNLDRQDPSERSVAPKARSRGPIRTEPDPVPARSEQRHLRWRPSPQWAPPIAGPRGRS